MERCLGRVEGRGTKHCLGTERCPMYYYLEVECCLETELSLQSAAPAMPDSRPLSLGVGPLRHSKIELCLSSVALVVYNTGTDWSRARPASPLQKGRSRFTAGPSPTTVHSTSPAQAYADRE